MFQITNQTNILDSVIFALHIGLILWSLLVELNFESCFCSITSSWRVGKIWLISKLMPLGVSTGRGKELPRLRIGQDSPTKGCRPLGRRDGQKHLGFPSIPVTSRREVRLFPNFYCWGTIKNPFKSLEIPLNHRLNLILTMKCNRSSISGYWFEPSWKINISQWEGWHPTYYGK